MVCMGGRQLIGGTDLRRGHFSAVTYVKMKELGPVVGGRTPQISKCIPLVLMVKVTGGLTVWSDGSRNKYDSTFLLTMDGCKSLVFEQSESNQFTLPCSTLQGKVQVQKGQTIYIKGAPITLANRNTQIDPDWRKMYN